MNWVDLAVLGVLGVSALLAFMRGLVREVLGIAAWAGAAYFAAWSHPFIKDRFRGWIGRADLADPIGVGMMFLAAVILLSVVAGMIAGVVRMSLVGGIDRTLGMVFGLLRGAVLIAFAYVLLGLAVPSDNWPQAVRQSRALPYAYQMAVLTTTLLPQEYRPAIHAPGSDAETHVDDLLHAAPLGRALTNPAPQPLLQHP